MNAGDRRHLPLTAEPLPFLRAVHIGRPVPGPVQPVGNPLALEEEPALRLHLGAGVRHGHTDAPAPAPEHPTNPVPTPSLPATGLSLPMPLALAGLGVGWALRRRTSPPQ